MHELGDSQNARGELRPEAGTGERRVGIENQSVSPARIPQDRCQILRVTGDQSYGLRLVGGRKTKQGGLTGLFDGRREFSAKIKWALNRIREKNSASLPFGQHRFVPCRLRERIGSAFRQLLEIRAATCCAGRNVRSCAVEKIGERGRRTRVNYQRMD